MSPDTLHIYPTALKARAVVREAARRGGVAFGARVMTFPELVDVLARDLGGCPAVLERPLATLVLEQALHAGGNMERLGPPGVVAELLDLLGELRAAFLAAEDLEWIVGACAPGAARERAALLARAYRAYDECLARLGAVDRRGRDRWVFERLSSVLACGEMPSLLRGVRRIVLAELYDFSLVEFLLVTTLISAVGDAELVVFAHPTNVDAARFLDRSWNRFVADQTIADQVLPEFVFRGGRQGSLAAALAGVFTSERPPPRPGDGSIRLREAPSRYAEVEATIRDIRERIAAGAAPERIAIVARDLTSYGDLIEDVCRRFRVPVAFRRGRPLETTPLFAACANLIACAAEGLPRERLESIASSDYFRRVPRSAARLLREVGYVDTRVHPFTGCLAHCAQREPRRHIGWEQVGARLATSVSALAALDQTRTIGGHVRALRRVFRQLGFLPVTPDPSLADVAARDARAWARLDALLSDLGAVGRMLAMGSVPLEEFLRVLARAAADTELADPSPPERAIHALGILDARGLDFDLVVLLGLDDGSFPQPRAESVLLPDEMRRTLNPLAAQRLRSKLGPRAHGLPLGGLLRTAREARLEEPFLFFLALSMPERELVLSYPTVDGSGAAATRSPFIDEVSATLAEGLVAEVQPFSSVVPPMEHCADVAELLGRAAADRWGRSHAVGDALGPVLRAEVSDGARRLRSIDRRAAIEEARAAYFLLPPGSEPRGVRASAWVGRLEAKEAERAARVYGRAGSPTAIEELAACRFKFFARRYLGLVPREAPGLEPDARERGTLVHRLLEEFFRTHPRLPEDPRAVRDAVRTFLAGAETDAALAIPPKDAAFLRLSLARLAVAFDAIIELERGTQVARDRSGVALERWLEHDLVFDLPDPTGGPSLQIHARPDRVEIERRGTRVVTVRVLDYKTSRDAAPFRAALRPGKPEKGLCTTAFQIPLYLRGVADRVGAAASSEIRFEGGYVVLLAPRDEVAATGVIGSGVLGLGPATGGEPAPRLDTAVHGLVGAAAAGRFDVDPVVCDPYCRFRPVCRYQPPPPEDETETIDV